MMRLRWCGRGLVFGLGPKKCNIFPAVSVDALALASNNLIFILTRLRFEYLFAAVPRATISSRLGKKNTQGYQCSVY